MPAHAAERIWKTIKLNGVLLNTQFVAGNLPGIKPQGRHRTGRQAQERTTREPAPRPRRQSFQLFLSRWGGFD